MHDTNTSPHELPRVGGWLLIAPIGTEIPPAVASGATFKTADWSEQWLMPDTIPSWVRVRSGCGVHDDVDFSVTFSMARPPVLPGPATLVVDDSGQGVRLLVPHATTCDRDPFTYHIHEGDHPAWSLLIAGYYGNPTEVRPYRVPVPANGVAS